MSGLCQVIIRVRVCCTSIGRFWYHSGRWWAVWSLLRPSILLLWRRQSEVQWFGVQHRPLYHKWQLSMPTKRLLCKTSLYRGWGWLWWWCRMWRLTCLRTPELRKHHNNRLLRKNMQQWLWLCKSRMQYWHQPLSSGFLQHWLVPLQPGVTMRWWRRWLWSPFWLWRLITVWQWQLRNRTNWLGLLHKWWWPVCKISL